MKIHRNMSKNAVPKFIKILKILKIVKILKIHIENFELTLQRNTKISFKKLVDFCWQIEAFNVVTQTTIIEILFCNICSLSKTIWSFYTIKQILWSNLTRMPTFPEGDRRILNPNESFFHLVTNIWARYIISITLAITPGFKRQTGTDRIMTNLEVEFRVLSWKPERRINSE